MSTFNVPVTIRIVGTLPPSPGIIPVSGYSMSADFSALPGDFLSVDSTGHFTARFSRRGGKISGPVQPGDKINFAFSIAAPLAVSSVSKPGPNVFAWTTVNNTSGTVTLTGVVTGNPMPSGTNHSEYDISLVQTGTESRWTIDPDFETDVNES